MKNKGNLWVTLGLLLVALIWGSGFIATQIAIDEGLSPTFIMFVRFTIASIILGTIFKKDIQQMRKRDFKMGVVAGCFLFLGFMLQTIGLVFTTPSSNAFITATNVVMVPFFSWIAFRERPEPKAFVAAFVCFSGIGMLAFSSGGGLKLRTGDVFTLFCAVAFALHTVSMGQFAPRMNTNILTFLQITSSAVFSFIAFLLVDRDFAAFTSIKGLLAVFYLAVFSTCIAYSIQTLSQRFASPSKVAIIISTEALVGSILSVILGFEPFTYFLFVGGIAIILSMLMIELDFISPFQSSVK